MCMHTCVCVNRNVFIHIQACMSMHACVYYMCMCAYMYICVYRYACTCALHEHTCVCACSIRLCALTLPYSNLAHHQKRKVQAQTALYSSCRLWGNSPHGATHKSSCWTSHCQSPETQERICLTKSLPHLPLTDAEMQH